MPREGNSKHARVIRISYTLSRDTTEEPTYRQFTTLAAELGLQRQDLLREALNDVFLKHGKPPIA
jgi:hypothetical protein